MPRLKRGSLLLWVVEDPSQSKVKTPLTKNTIIHRDLSIDKVKVLITKNDLDITKKINKQKIDKLTEIFGK